MFANAGQRVFNFTITNEYNPLSLAWRISYGDLTSAPESDDNTTLAHNETLWVFAEHEYLNNGNYTVNAIATSEGMTEETDNIIVSITGI